MLHLLLVLQLLLLLYVTNLLLDLLHLQLTLLRFELILTGSRLLRYFTCQDLRWIHVCRHFHLGYLSLRFKSCCLRTDVGIGFSFQLRL